MMGETNALGLVAASLNALATQVTNIVGLAESNITAAFRISDKANYRKEIARIDEFLSQLRRLSGTQVVFLERLEHYIDKLETYFQNPGATDPPDPGTQLRRGVSELRQAVDDVQKHLAKCIPNTLTATRHCMMAMRYCLFAATAFCRVWRLFSEPDKPNTNDLATLKKMKSDYTRLMIGLNKYRRLLGQLAENLTNKSKE
jgi:hypothetical protein